MFSVLMVCVDLHSMPPHARITKENFIRGNTGINDGGSFEREYLGALYDDCLRNRLQNIVGAAPPSPPRTRCLVS